MAADLVPSGQVVSERPAFPAATPAGRLGNKPAERVQQRHREFDGGGNFECHESGVVFEPEKKARQAPLEFVAVGGRGIADEQNSVPTRVIHSVDEIRRQRPGGVVIDMEVRRDEQSPI